MTYDEILRIDITRNAFLVGYADNLAADTLASDLEDGQYILNQVIAASDPQRRRRKLFTRSQMDTITTMNVNEKEVIIKTAVKYLDLMLTVLQIYILSTGTQDCG